MIKLTLSGTDKTVIDALQRRGPAVVKALVDKINNFAIRLQAHIQSDKLSGQVLKHRTGKLKGSIEVRPASATGSAIEAHVVGAGGTAFYGRYHEYGTSDAYPILPVNKKALAFFPSGSIGAYAPTRAAGAVRYTILRQLSSTKAAIREQARAQFAEMGGVIRKSVMHPPIEERSFMRSGKADMEAEIRQGLQDAAAKAFHEG